MVCISLKKELNEKRSIEKADNGILKPKSEARKIYEKWL